MDKISLPFRIVLIVALLFAVVWFLVLRPKPVTGSEPAVTPPGVTGLANDVAKANKAVEDAIAAAEHAANPGRGARITGAAAEAPPAADDADDGAADDGTTGAAPTS